MSSSGITYSGKLIIENKYKKFTSYNHGSNQLFRLLSTILVGEMYSRQDLPAKFTLVNESVDEALSHANAPQNVLVRSSIDIAKQSAITSSGIIETKFSGMLTSGNLISTQEVTGNITLLLLSSKEVVLAAVPYAAESYNIVKAGGQAHLTWILTFENKETSTNDVQEESET